MSEVGKEREKMKAERSAKPELVISTETPNPRCTRAPLSRHVNNWRMATIEPCRRGAG